MRVIRDAERNGYFYHHSGNIVTVSCDNFYLTAVFLFVWVRGLHVPEAFGFGKH